MRSRQRRLFKTVLIHRIQVAQGTLEVSFQRPEGFTFESGQYVQIRLPKLLYRDRKGPSRVLSIASSPLDEESVSIAFRDTGSGFKRTLRELPIGSDVMIEGPHGFYTLPRDPSRPLVFIAGGIGITPFMSMLRFAAGSDEGSAPITLLYANWSGKTAAYLDEIEKMERGNPRLTLRKKFGLLDQAFIGKSVKDLKGPIWYIAGPPAMVDATRSALHVLGVAPGDVHFEEFVGY